MLGILIVLLVSLGFLAKMIFFQSKPAHLIASKNSTVYLLSQEGKGVFLHLIRARDGKELSSYQLSGTATDEFFLPDQNTLYMTEPGSLSALKINGQLLWKHVFPEQNASLNIFSSDAVYVHSARTLYTLDKKDGTLRWQYTFKGDIDSISVISQKVFVTIIPSPDTRTIYALDSQKGQVIWQFTRPGDAQPFVSDSTVLFSSLNGVYALQVEDGKQKWYHAGQGFEFGPKAVINGMAFFSDFINPNGTADAFSGHSFFPGEARKSQCQAGCVRALDVSTGQQIWSYPCKDDENCNFGLLQVISDRVYFSTGPRVIALQASNGQFLWSYQCIQLCDETDATPDGVYIYQNTTPENFPTGVSVSEIPTPSSRSGFVEALTDDKGQVQWRVSFTTGPLDLSLEDNGFLYIGASFGPDGRLYVLQAHNGHILWERGSQEEILQLWVFDS